ncbi:MAG TPA: malate synthase A [Solirubrobacteraceae bacterium]|nr:malate synthase A [Solirubrobacteraceae bacterium]
MGSIANVSVTQNISADPHPSADEVLTPQAIDFLLVLHHRFEHARLELLSQRAQRQARFDKGERPDFLKETTAVREGHWRALSAPDALRDRRVEITGPVERKMMINALNSGAKVFMADLEDSNSPTWGNVIEGQLNLIEAVRRTIELETGEKVYRLRPAEELATLVVRPRGWHLPEKHFSVDGEPMSASLFDFGLYAFHNSQASLEQGFGPYFYLPKLEGHLEARLWNEVMAFTEDALGLDRGTIRATVLIETITAAFEMDEIIYELRERICGLNAGRWDYIFSIAKRFHADPDFVLPDRSLVTMTTPFMRAYTELLVKTCHKRGTHAIGGMSAFIPNRRKPEVTEAALGKVSEDKRREAGDGFDGTWVAHPDLVPTARAEFDAVLGNDPNQLVRQRPEVDVKAADLLRVTRPEGGITESGLGTNIDVGIRYIASWLSGVGAAAINDLMEDAATAEISRAQVWQWIHHEIPLTPGGAVVTAELVRQLADKTIDELTAAGYDPELLGRARDVFELVALAEDFPAFLTLPAYQLIA